MVEYQQLIYQQVLLVLLFLLQIIQELLQTNALTVVPNGSEKIGGVAASASLNVNGQAATFIYVDGTEGWINTQETQTTQTGLPPYITATGGTVTCSGDYRIHTFTGSGSFVVTSAGSAAPSSGTGSNKVDYLVVAAGGSGGSGYGGGGGAGGYRESPGADNGSYTVSPLGASPAVSLGLITGTTYPITVGAGGAQIPAGGPGSGALGPSGTNSTFSTITSAGGGGGGGSTGPSAPNPTADGADGGSGGGGSWDAPGTGGTALGGTGNTPPVSPAQGKNGGHGRHLGPSYSSQGGGGGAISKGADQQPGTDGNVGGGGATSSINGTPTARAGGGGAAGSPGAGGTGGGGSGSPSPVPARGGGVNTGGGGGGALHKRILHRSRRIWYSNIKI